jgi:hypothetical protein
MSVLLQVLFLFLILILILVLVLALVQTSRQRRLLPKREGEGEGDERREEREGTWGRPGTTPVEARSIVRVVQFPPTSPRPVRRHAAC